MLIVLYGTNMWRGESGGFSWELSPTWTNIASVQWELLCISVDGWKKKIRMILWILKLFFSLQHTLLCRFRLKINCRFGGRHMDHHMEFWLTAHQNNRLWCEGHITSCTKTFQTHSPTSAEQTENVNAGYLTGLHLSILTPPCLLPPPALVLQHPRLFTH